MLDVRNGHFSRATSCSKASICGGISKPHRLVHLMKSAIAIGSGYVDGGFNLSIQKRFDAIEMGGI